MDNEHEPPIMDKADQVWIESFDGIPKGSVVEGFVTVLTWINPDGTPGWRTYNTLDRPLSFILGLLDMAKFSYLMSNLTTDEGPDK